MAKLCFIAAHVAMKDRAAIGVDLEITTKKTQIHTTVMILHVET